eukprot:CAMPEP_0196576682 /NCGR_PEP_ID=MMETSP1081-20130531/5887_1 /TAXON_ID=36882 /ORGANISM="Pyramimonas amylifera, Strain CCMP720" /LENGTH=373 /DNA_ID=CAMNT_0041895363 /DNA_START=230 /DNA_END=1351 /DNA_ORIENTATION=+
MRCPSQFYAALQKEMHVFAKNNGAGKRHLLDNNTEQVDLEKMVSVEEAEKTARSRTTRRLLGKFERMHPYVPHRPHHPTEGTPQAAGHMNLRDFREHSRALALDKADAYCRSAKDDNGPGVLFPLLLDVEVTPKDMIVRGGPSVVTNLGVGGVPAVPRMVSGAVNEGVSGGSVPHAGVGAVSAVGSTLNLAPTLKDSVVAPPSEFGTQGGALVLSAPETFTPEFGLVSGQHDRSNMNFGSVLNAVGSSSFRSEEPTSRGGVGNAIEVDQDFGGGLGSGGEESQQMRLRERDNMLEKQESEIEQESLSNTDFTWILIFVISVFVACMGVGIGVCSLKIINKVQQPDLKSDILSRSVGMQSSLGRIKIVLANSSI